MKVSRREFERLAFAAAASLLPSRLPPGEAQTLDTQNSRKSTFNGVLVGCTTNSMGRIPLDQAILAMSGIGFGEAELHPFHVEKFYGARQNPDREKLREWRLTVPLEEYERIGKQFSIAGMDLYSYSANFQIDCTDAEIERFFEMTRALGASIITAVGAKDLLRRLDPFARKHKIRCAIHNETASAEAVRTESDFDEVRRGLSDFMAICLDVGHLVAAGGDPVAFLKKNHDDVICIHIKDRKKDNGPDMPFGQGDSPVKEILEIVRDSKYRVPCNIECEVRGADRVAAVRANFDYCRRVLLAPAG